MRGSHAAAFAAWFLVILIGGVGGTAAMTLAVLLVAAVLIYCVLKEVEDNKKENSNGNR